MNTRFFLSLTAAVMLSCITAAAAMSFTIEGPEETYNQIRVVNETSQVNFKCRVVIMNGDETTKEAYGTYMLKELGDSDSNTNRISRGTQLGILMPKDFPVEVDFSVEYKDYPLFDAIIIHLFDKNANPDEEFE